MNARFKRILLPFDTLDPCDSKRDSSSLSIDTSVCFLLDIVTIEAIARHPYRVKEVDQNVVRSAYIIYTEPNFNLPYYYLFRLDASSMDSSLIVPAEKNCCITCYYFFPPFFFFCSGGNLFRRRGFFFKRTLGSFGLFSLLCSSEIHQIGSETVKRWTSPGQYRRILARRPSPSCLQRR